MDETGLPSGYRREAHDSVTSTSSVVLERARNGDPGGLWVTARDQTEGRGRRGRHWTTGEGNLAASLLLVDPAPPPIAATISFVAGLALHRAIVGLAGIALVERLKLKWPNDLLLGGRKVAGILVEGEKMADGRFAVAVGIGVNCLSHPQSEATFAADDLMTGGVAIESERLFAGLAFTMADEIERWDRGGGFAEVRSAWLDRAYGIGERITVNLNDRVIDGSFETLDDDGRLVLGRPGGARETISAGDLFFAGRA
ncbi:MAG: biotin--[acetyl-CoA-carboxylase] ligase [Bauldia sp.]|uniref:biotin--[acetyl-CoA-carboxylase] ligase n=1 Tax=Bauldia sp. TaxID=2575872 RepID=UPI001DFCBFD9|nr:biotin--[acetyl-CoA-carboxylase] ligase [Bauldia sp.]MCB1495669.1 biotin--[acetyl-CoA-carboxylase] ligase [Bauldia sp.]